MIVLDDPKIPERSLWKIIAAVYDFGGRWSRVRRDVYFEAERTDSGQNVTTVRVVTLDLDFERVDEEMLIVYRGGLFRRAVITDIHGVRRLYRLSGVIDHLNGISDDPS